MDAGPDEENEAAALLGPEVMKEYRDGCADSLAALEAGVGEAGFLETLRVTAHRLTGSAGTYGYPEASVLAARLEKRAVEAPPPDAEEIRAAVAALRRALRLPG